ncbi:MAG: hypothetical protein WA973_05725 [Mesorhizobium sp.]
MNKPNDPALGEAVQNYVRRKWRYREKWTHIGAEKMQLGNDLVARIDLLGIDDKMLLDVQGDRVISRIGELERRLAEEDLGGT